MKNKKILLRRMLSRIILFIFLLLPALALADDAETKLKSLITAKAAMLADMHKKARDALLEAAANPLFNDYFNEKDKDKKKAIKEKIDALELQVQSNFSVDEMCLINIKGKEESRIVANKIATDLSPDESKNVFYDGAFGAVPKTVYTTPVYISDDTNEWVIGYATPLTLANKKVAILHYEHDLKKYQENLNKDLSDTKINLLTVTSDGFVISDSHNKISTAKAADEKPETYFKKFALGALGLDQVQKLPNGFGVIDADGKKLNVAVQQVEDWTLVAVTTP